MLIFLPMNVTKIYNHPTQFLAITSLTTQEFDLLLSPFIERWQEWYKYYDFRMKRRSKPLSSNVAQSPTRTLSTNEDKLFFILYMFKNNPLQQLAAASFDMDQGQVSKWFKVLSPILADAIRDLHLQPARNMEELVRLFRDRRNDANKHEECRDIQTLNLDATERPICRKTDFEAQKHDYSGKQKHHTVKNSIVCDEYRYIHFLGPTWRGAIHDKRMIELELPSLSDLEGQDVWLAKDTAYQAYCPAGVILLEPFKATQKNPLTALQKQINSWVSSIRTVVEHAIGGIKRLRLVSEKWRLSISDRIDQAMFIAAGLHNLRTSQRQASYIGAHARTCARLDIFHS